MSEEPIEIKFDKQEVIDKILELAKRGENLRPLMKNIAGVFADSTEDNFAEEGRPDKWTELSQVTKDLRKETGNWPGQILQVSGQLASSITTYYDDDSAIIGSNLKYAAIHQLGGQAGRNKKVKIPARPYINLVEDDYDEILHEIEEHLTEKIKK